jgi:DNA-binding transcriptional MerR regulator
VKPHVLRYWEQEFTQLKPVKRRGNRRYYQHHEVLLIRRIRELLYEQGFTISGARNRLEETGFHTESETEASSGEALGELRGRFPSPVGVDVDWRGEVKSVLELLRA